LHSHALSQYLLAIVSTKLISLHSSIRDQTYKTCFHLATNLSCPFVEYKVPLGPLSFYAQHCAMVPRDLKAVSQHSDYCEQCALCIHHVSLKENLHYARHVWTVFPSPGRLPETTLSWLINVQMLLSKSDTSYCYRHSAVSRERGSHLAELSIWNCMTRHLTHRIGAVQRPKRAVYQ